ncbi:SWIB/MDM2 domain-containing protein [Chthonobacter rhizosphaerae]|uniref:SWIB/MDM2 domain-containing protein n=1 Tax=Chthonobacter rhizosphaerae TaxID=2735553 RepID=UPI0015EE6737|nr:SWIB/MDM2 domain-containing protein [Chthonobacter rhizosphaerae]
MASSKKTADAGETKKAAGDSKKAGAGGSKKTASAGGSKASASADGSKKPGRNAGGAIAQPVKPSKELSAVIGDQAMPRGEVVSKVWDYIKSNKLQNPDDGREIIADAKLEPIFGKKKVTMFEMNKLLSAHLE